METVMTIISWWWLLIHLDDFIEITNEILKNKKKVILIPKKIITCPKCTMFWVGLVISGSVGIAGTLSIGAYLFDKYLMTTDIEL
jgi:hypothetical protein